MADNKNRQETPQEREQRLQEESARTGTPVAELERQEQEQEAQANENK